MKRMYFFVAVLAAVVALMMPVNHVLADNSPLCFTARNGSVTVKFDIKNVTHTIQYSTDGTNWSTYASNSDITINANQSVYFRAETNQTVATAFSGNSPATSSRFYFSSSTSGTVEGSGNIMSLYGPDCPNLPLQQYAFWYMFSGDQLLTTAPALPATTLADYCYYSMFYGCSSLTQAPALPATTLANYCYYGMFLNCSTLVVNTEAPGKEWMIPATTTATDALEGMFTGTGGTMNGTPSVNTTYYIASDPTTAAEDVEVGREYIVFTEGNGIVVSGAAEVSICDASGRVVYDGKMEGEMERFEVPMEGVYFVRCDDGEMMKVVVR